jgi:hypothetical protein
MADGVKIVVDVLQAANVAGDRVADLWFSQPTQTPHIVVRRSTVAPLAYATGGPSGADDEYVDVEITASTTSDLQDTINDVRGELDSFTGSQSGRLVTGCFLQSSGDTDVLSSQQDSNNHLYVSTLTYQIVHQPTT